MNARDESRKDMEEGEARMLVRLWSIMVGKSSWRLMIRRLWPRLGPTQSASPKHRRAVGSHSG